MSCIDQGNQLLIITNTMNLITTFQLSISMYFCMVTFYSVDIKLFTTSFMCLHYMQQQHNKKNCPSQPSVIQISRIVYLKYKKKETENK